jgi:hypothetical protein
MNPIDAFDSLHPLIQLMILHLWPMLLFPLMAWAGDDS